MRPIVVVTSVGTEDQANLIAEELVVRRHASCVNVVPGVRSLYRWQGKICRDGEFLLLIKTMDEEYEAVAATIRELHSYELPEILSFPVERGDPSFLAWIASCLDKSAVFSDEPDESVPLRNPDDTAF